MIKWLYLFIGIVLGYLSHMLVGMAFWYLAIGGLMAGSFVGGKWLLTRD